MKALLVLAGAAALAGFASPQAVTRMRCLRLVEDSPRVLLYETVDEGAPGLDPTSCSPRHYIRRFWLDTSTDPLPPMAPVEDDR